MATGLFNRAKALFDRDTVEQEPVAPRKVPNKFHAVTIAPGPGACQEVRALRDRRFLSQDAPSLPLKGCGSPQCSCRYEHHDDRRVGNRRARDIGVSIDGYIGEEHRGQGKRGRRQNDGR